MMTNLQGGITSSQLSPQAYKHSSQKSSFQDTFNSQNVSSASGQSLLNATPSTISLRVESNQNLAVLSTSRTSTPQNNIPANSTSNYVPIALIVLIVSVALAVYFFKMYKSIVVIENE